MLQIDAKPPKITFSQNIFEFSVEVMATWGIFVDLCGFGWQQLTGVYRLPVQVGLSTSRLETAVPCSKFYQEKRKKKNQRSHFETGPWDHWFCTSIWLDHRVLKVKVVSNSLWHHGLYSPPSSSVHGILQARILEWVAIPFSSGSSLSRDLPYPGMSCISCIGRQALYQLSQQLPTPVFLPGESHGQRSLAGSMESPRRPWGTQIFSQTSFWVFLWGYFWMNLTYKSADWLKEFVLFSCG